MQPNATRETATQVKGAVNAVVAMAEAIRELKRVPSGELYARVMGYMDLASYTKVIDLLKRAGLVEEQAHLLTWIGGSPR